jgi:hypothetical protein
VSEQKERSGTKNSQIGIGKILDNFLKARPFLFATVSISASEIIQPPIQWVPEALSMGVKRPGHEADYSPHLVSRLRTRGVTSLLPNTSSWGGAKFSIATTLLFIL